MARVESQRQEALFLSTHCCWFKITPSRNLVNQDEVISFYRFTLKSAKPTKAALRYVQEYLTEKHFLQVVDETVQEVLGQRA